MSLSPPPGALSLPQAIARAVAGEVFSADEMAALIGLVMDGHATPAQLAAFLIALRCRGETVDEVVGAARALKARALPLWAADEAPPQPLLDTCGTGGDGAGTLNVSTLAALVAAACGAQVAKHGNRALSSRSGSADVLEALGVNVQATPAQVARCLRQVGIGFLFAPAFHGATRAAAQVRREIGVRTIFNLLGPLTNPAGARRQVVGVFARRFVEPLAQALGALGAEHALVVHSETALCGATSGLDELSPDGVSHVAEWRDGALRSYTLTAEDFGLSRVTERADLSLRGGEAAENASAARRLLAGEADPREAGWKAVVMTAAAGLWLCGRSPDLPDGAAQAAAALQEGRAARLLARLAEVSHG